MSHSRALGSSVVSCSSVLVRPVLPGCMLADGCRERQIPLVMTGNQRTMLLTVHFLLSIFIQIHHVSRSRAESNDEETRCWPNETEIHSGQQQLLAATVML